MLTPLELREIAAQWGLSQAQFAELLGANPRTFQDWVQGRRPIPNTVKLHVATIQKLRLLYKAWDQFATPLAATEEFDQAVDAHEKLWSELFPELNRLIAREP